MFIISWEFDLLYYTIHMIYNILGILNEMKVALRMIEMLPQAITNDF